MRIGDIKHFLALAVDRYVRCGMDRRSFLWATAKLGLGGGALGLTSHMPFSRGGFIAPAAAQDIQWSPEMINWLKEAVKPFAGQTIWLATESTPPTNAIKSALKPYFTETIGTNVEIEVLPLEQVLR
jgi:multiple sugar transport system substrate-binding protein